MTGIEVESFRAVSLGDRATIEEAIGRRGLISCDYNFVNLYCWGEIYGIRWAMRDGTLMLYSERDDLLYEPVGDGVGIRELLSLSDEFIEKGRGGDFALVHRDFIERNAGIKDHFDVVPDEENANYIYSAESLFELRGRKLHSKKNLLSQFRRNNRGYVCREMVDADHAECFDLAEKWCEERYCRTIGYTHERSALRRALEARGALGLRGLVIERAGVKMAFSLFSRQRDDTATVHFEKFDREIRGSAQAINWETARRLRGDYRFINREQDLGLEGLRRSKRSYQPEFVLEAFKLVRRGGAG